MSCGEKSSHVVRTIRHGWHFTRSTQQGGVSLLQRGAIASRASNIRPDSGAQLHRNKTARQSIDAETRLFLPVTGTLRDGARSYATAMRTAKRDGPSGQSQLGIILRLVHGLRGNILVRADGVCSILHRRRAARERNVTYYGAGQRRVAMNDAQRYRMHAAECLSAASWTHTHNRLDLAVARSPAYEARPLLQLERQVRRLPGAFRSRWPNQIERALP
jgi:hypothetical protein